eukprot:78516-Rhodomonas_salina.1
MNGGAGASRAEEMRRQNSEKKQKQALDAGSAKLLALKTHNRPAVFTRSAVVSYLATLHELEREFAKASSTRQIEACKHSQLLIDVELEILDFLQAL